MKSQEVFSSIKRISFNVECFYNCKWKWLRHMGESTWRRFDNLSITCDNSYFFVESISQYNKLLNNIEVIANYNINN